MTTLIIIGVWLVSGLLTLGITFAHFEHDCPRLISRRENAGFATLLSLFGPLSLLVSFFFSGFAEHGLLWPWQNIRKDGV